jgi:hypothetical protein
MAQKFSAPTIDRMHPASPSAAPGLRPDLPRSDRETGRPSPSADGGLEEFRELAPSLARNSATSARSTSSCSRNTSTSVSLASITCRSRALATRSAATSSGADGTPGTNHQMIIVGENVINTTCRADSPRSTGSASPPIPGAATCPVTSEDGANAP